MFKRKKKRTLLERLTGTIHLDDYEDLDDVHDGDDNKISKYSHLEEEEDNHNDNLGEIENSSDGQLAVDVFNTEDSIVIKAMIAGVRPSDMDIDIARDMVTIRGVREEDHDVSNQDYYHQELYWGSFSRNILLPEEVNVEEAEAVEKNGLLTIKLPKIDKHKKTKLQVKSR